jgi:hypothetical protein
MISQGFQVDTVMEILRMNREGLSLREIGATLVRWGIDYRDTDDWHPMRIKRIIDRWESSHQHLSIHLAQMKRQAQ